MHGGSDRRGTGRGVDSRQAFPAVGGGGGGGVGQSGAPAHAARLASKRIQRKKPQLAALQQDQLPDLRCCYQIRMKMNLAEE